MLIDPTTVEPQPWRNGEGLTRDIATRMDPQGDLFWRVSVADLPTSAAFSTFPDTDRVFIALGDVTLCVGDTEYDLTCGDQIEFDGATNVTSTAPEPTQALNVMVRRGAARITVLLRASDQHDLNATVSVTLVPGVADIYIEPTTSKDRYA